MTVGPARKIRILCVDDHGIVRDGISLVISLQHDMEVVGTAATAEGSVVQFQTHRPDVTVMDLFLGQGSGVDAIRAIRQLDPGARIVVLTMYQGEEDVYRAIEAGAATYLLKDTVAGDLIRTIREVYADVPLRHSPRVESRLAERAQHRSLTPRELQILDLLFHGLRNREIGVALGIRELTVEVHVRNLLAKLEVKDRGGAVHVGLRRGLIHPDP